MTCTVRYVMSGGCPHAGIDKTEGATQGQHHRSYQTDSNSSPENKTTQVKST